MQGESIVLVHGLWLNGSEFKWMDIRLRRYGYRTKLFKYPTISQGVEENAEALWLFLEQEFGPNLSNVPAGSVHLVCHSLGGLVALRMLERYPDAPIGRMMALGSPFQGSFSAQRLARWPGGAYMLGKSLANALDGQRAWRVPEGREIGVLAGTLPFGLSRFMLGLDKPNDGVVALSETRLSGAAHGSLAVVHVGLVFSRRAARIVRRFLVLGEIG